MGEPASDNEPPGWNIQHVGPGMPLDVERRTLDVRCPPEVHWEGPAALTGVSGQTSLRP